MKGSYTETSLTFLGHVQELREMVIRGPFEHPGANAVEDENGRLVNLTQMSLQVIFITCMLD